MSSYYNNIPIIQNITVDYGNIDTLDAKTVKTDNLFIDNDKSAENIITQSITLDTNKIEEIQLTSKSSYASNNDKIMSSGRINELLDDKVDTSTLNNYVLKNDTSQLTLNNSNSTITLNTLTASIIKGSNQQINFNNNLTIMKGDYRIGGSVSDNWYLRIYSNDNKGATIGVVGNTFTPKIVDFIGFVQNAIRFYFYNDATTILNLSSKSLNDEKYFEYHYGNSFIDLFTDKIKLSNLTFDNTTIVNSIISSNDTTTSNDTSIPTTQWVNNKISQIDLSNYVQKNDTSQLTLNNSNSSITAGSLRISSIKGINNNNQNIDIVNDHTTMNGTYWIGGINGYWFLSISSNTTDGALLGIKHTNGNVFKKFLSGGLNRVSFYHWDTQSNMLNIMSKTDTNNDKYFGIEYSNSFIDIKPNTLKLSNLSFDDTTIVNSIIPSTDTTTSNDTSIPTTKWVKDNIISPDLTNYVQKTDTSQLNLNNTSSTITTGTLTSTTITSTNINNSNTIQSNTFKTGRSYLKENSDNAITFYYNSPSYGTYTILSLYGNGIETTGLRLNTKWGQSNNKTMTSFTTSTETTSPSDTSIPTTKWVFDKLYPIVNVLELIFDIPFNNNLNKVYIKDDEGSIPLYYYSVIGNPRKWQFTGNAVVLRNNTFTLYKNYIQLQQGDFYTYNLSNYDFKILTTYNSNKTVEHRDYMMASGYPIEINNYNVNNFQFATPYLFIKVMPGTMGAWEFHYYNDLKFVGNRNQATYTLNPTKNTLYFLCSNLYFSTSEYKFYYDLTLFYVSANSSSSYSGYPYHSLYSLEIDYSFHYNDVFNLDISTKPPYEEETNYAYAHHLNFKNRSWYNWNEPNGVLCDREQHEANVFYDKLTPRVIDSLT